MNCSFLNALLIITLLISSTFFTTNAQISTPCTASMLTSFTPCLNFVTGGGSPTKQCCDSLKNLVAGSTDCTCLIITGNVPVSVPFINRTLAISLPRACRSSVPLQCKATGVPLPAPGPVLFGPNKAPPAPAPLIHSPGPTLAPAPAPRRHSHSPKASIAAAAAAPPRDAVAPSQADNSLNFSPASPAEVPLKPSANPGIRPVVGQNSASYLSIPSLPLILMSIGYTIFM